MTIDAELEEAIEAAYWNFNARCNGYAAWKGHPTGERDAFKSEMRIMIRRIQAQMTPGPIDACIDDAIKSFGGPDDGVFNAAGFGSAFASRCNLKNSLDGIVVNAILTGYPGIKHLPGGSHYQRVTAPSPSSRND